MHTKKFLWIPHYTIIEGYIFFMDTMVTSISVPSNLAEFISVNKIFTEKMFLSYANENLLSKLKNEGIIIELNTSIPLNKLQDRKVLVIQPHSDDFALSCGGTVAKLKYEDNFDIDCITIFCNHAKQGFKWNNRISIDDEGYTKLRMEEDILAMDYLGGKADFCNFEFSDALRRGRHIFSREQYIKEDFELIIDIANYITEIIKDTKYDIILVPAAIGWHIDHRITFSALFRAIKELEIQSQIYLYEDFPYCNTKRFNYWSRMKEIKDKINILPIYTDITKSISDKYKLINFYKSQILDVTYNNIKQMVDELALSTVIEADFLNDNIPNGIVYAERLWKVIDYKSVDKSVNPVG